MVNAQSKFPNGIDLGRNAVIGAEHFGGTVPHGILRVAANVASGETVVIGGDTYRVANLATDSTKTVSGGQLNNTRDYVSMVYFPAHGRVVGDVIRVDSEYMAVVGVKTADYLHVIRGISGSTIAAHADGASFFTEAASGGGGIGVCHNATLTPVVFTANLTADINDKRRGIEPVVAVNSDANTVIVQKADAKGGRPVAGVDTTATTETLAGANNAWDAATFGAGVAPGILYIAKRSPIAAEVTKGEMWFPFPFTPTIVDIQVITTATGARAAWDGASSVVGNRVRIDNSGVTDWATTHYILVYARG